MRHWSSVELNEEWRQLASAWIKEVREGRNPYRAGLLDSSMLQACGDVRGLRVLDSGCGEGRFCRMLSDRGARFVLGVDLCEPMIVAAARLQTARAGYVVATVENLGFLPDVTFDLAVSYLNQCDLTDFRANTREVYRVLKPGGRFVIANLHPMRSAVGGWQRDAGGNKQHVILDRYFDVGERDWIMLGLPFTNFHRTLAAYINAFLETGFTLEAILEPAPSTSQLQQYPELGDELRVPNFIIYQLIRPKVTVEHSR